LSDKLSGSDYVCPCHVDLTVKIGSFKASKLIFVLMI